MTHVALPSLRLARLTAMQVHAMIDAGILRDGEPLELIDGLLVLKDRSARGASQMTIGEKHNLVIKLLGRLDALLVPLGAHMQTQGPVRLSEIDEPEPDGAVVLGEPRDYAKRLPATKDVGALIEVADSSLDSDRTLKAARYALAGVAQYVIVNIPDGCVEIYEGARGEAWAAKRTITGGETFSLRVTAERSLQVPASALLP